MDRPLNTVGPGAPGPTPRPKWGSNWRPDLKLNWGGAARRLVVVLVAIFIALPIAATLVFKFVPVPPGLLVAQRLVEGRGYARSWRPISQISPNLAYAVIAAEDARFCTHHGFDGEAIEKALAHNGRSPGRIRGGSTLSQQTAKNVFLWPGRDWVRKGLEAWDTVLIETLWGKRRILEVYLNVVEWAPGVYGAEAASQHWFHVPAARLTPAQADRLAAILPSPLKWRAAEPGAYVRKRSGRIARNVGAVKAEDLARCVRGS